MDGIKQRLWHGTAPKTIEARMDCANTIERVIIFFSAKGVVLGK